MKFLPAHRPWDRFLLVLWVCRCDGTCRNVEQVGSTNANVSAPGEDRGVKTQVLCLEGQLGLYNFYYRYTLTSVVIFLGGGFSKAYLPGVFGLSSP